MSGESPTRPGSLQQVPPVEVAEKRLPLASRSHGADGSLFVAAVMLGGVLV